MNASQPICEAELDISDRIYGDPAVLPAVPKNGSSLRKVAAVAGISVLLGVGCTKKGRALVAGAAKGVWDYFLSHNLNASENYGGVKTLSCCAVPASPVSKPATSNFYPENMIYHEEPCCELDYVGPVGESIKLPYMH